LRVRYAETDQMGVVYYANYLVWMEVGRVELVRSLGFQYKDLEQSEGLYLSVIEATCRYIYPARYDQEVIVETRIVKATSRTVEFGYRLLSAEPQRLLAKGSTRHIWLNREWRPATLPEKYRRALGVAFPTVQ
jgi:acyl-CoA thioester hydrolase